MYALFAIEVKRRATDKIRSLELANNRGQYLHIIRIVAGTYVRNARESRVNNNIKRYQI